MATTLTIGETAKRSGVAASALRFYEERGLIASERAGSAHRRFPRPVLRRVAFIVFAQRVGLTLDEIGAELAKLPPDRRSDPSRLVAAVEQVDGADRRPDRRAGAPEGGPHGVHRLRLPVAGPLQARESRRQGRPPRPRAALLGGRPAARGAAKEA